MLTTWNARVTAGTGLEDFGKRGFYFGYKEVDTAFRARTLDRVASAGRALEVPALSWQADSAYGNLRFGAYETDGPLRVQAPVAALGINISAAGSSDAFGGT